MTVHIVGLAGSLRRGSFNKAALRAAGELLPAGARLEILELSDIPFFNEDLEKEGMPQAVQDLRARVSAADAILISTPEYNYSLPPVLKNALDWGSRGGLNVWNGKPLAIMSASPGIFGGARAQYHLRQVCVVLNLFPLNRPEVFIGSANTKFDADGTLVDEYTRQAIAKLLQALADMVRLMNKEQ